MSFERKGRAAHPYIAGLIGICLSIAALLYWLGYREHAEMRRWIAGASWTEGTIVSVQRVTSMGQKHSSVRYWHTATFTAVPGGPTIEVRDDAPSQIFAPGERVGILYHADFPKAAHIDHEAVLFGGLSFYSAFGTFFAAIGIITSVMFVRYVVLERRRRAGA
jgi:hypothetical protein